jgi:hypothetical protein
MDSRCHGRGGGRGGRKGVGGGLDHNVRQGEPAVDNVRQAGAAFSYHGHHMRSNIRELQGEMDWSFASQRSGPFV